MRSRSLLHLGLLGLISLLAVGVVAGVAAQRASDSHGDLVELREQTVTALDGLTDVQVHQAQIGLLFQGLLAETGVDPTVLNASLDQANQYSVASAQAWARYKDAALGLPGEAELRDEFDVSLETGTAAGTELGAVVFGSLSSGDVSAPALQLRLDAIRATASSSQLLVATLDRLIELYQDELATTVALIAGDADAASDDVARATAVAAVVLLGAWTLAMRSSLRRGRLVASERHERDLEAARNELDARLQRGLVMAVDEESALKVVGLALQELDLTDTEVLVADSSRAHFHQVVAPGGDEASGGCGVSTPNQCPAARTGQTQVFTSSQSVDACPYLRENPKSPCSAVCAPINIAGKAVGVMTSTGRHGHVADPNSVANLELVARKTGERLGALRTFSKSEIQARTDALTGLLNRRSVETEASRVLDGGERYAVAFGDLDHFKRLNDVYGHDTGDRALRLFSRVLRDSVRPQDIPARYGGEEFVVILPGCTSTDAVNVVERVRERLAASLEGSSTPPFTVSFGVASDDSGLPFADLVSMADAALLTAKAEGRNCTVVGGTAGQAAPAAAMASVSEIA